MIVFCTNIDITNITPNNNNPSNNIPSIIRLKLDLFLINLESKTVPPNHANKNQSGIPKTIKAIHSILSAGITRISAQTNSKRINAIMPNTPITWFVEYLGSLFSC